MQDVSLEVASLRRRVRLLSLSLAGCAAIFLTAAGGAEAFAHWYVETDGWKLQTKNGSGTATPRLICTADVDLARLKVQNANIELFPQTTAQLPGSAAAGAIAYDSTVSKFKVYNGSAWAEPGPPDPYEATFLVSPTANLLWTDMPAAVTEFANNSNLRKKIDLTDFVEFRLAASQVNAGATTAKLRVQYSTDQSTWNNLEDTTTTGDLPSYLPAIAKVSTFRPIVAAARTDVFLRVVGLDGNGTADPTWRMLAIQMK